MVSQEVGYYKPKTNHGEPRVILWSLSFIFLGSRVKDNSVQRGVSYFIFDLKDEKHRI